MKYVKMKGYRFDPLFSRVFIISAKKAYAEVTGDTIPEGCDEITENTFSAIAAEYEIVEPEPENTEEGDSY